MIPRDASAELVKRIDARAVEAIHPEQEREQVRHIQLPTLDTDAPSPKGKPVIRWHDAFLEIEAEPGETEADLYQLAWSAVRLSVPPGAKILWRSLPATIFYRDFVSEKVTTKLRMRFAWIHPNEVVAQLVNQQASRSRA